MKTLLQQLVNAGLNAEDDLWTQFRVRFINTFSLLCLVVSAPWHVIIAIQEDYTTFSILVQWQLLFLIWQLFFASVVYLHYKHQFLAAKMVCILTTSLSALSVTYLLGFQSGFFLYYYAPPFYIFWFFDLKKEKIFIVLTAIIYIICITVILVYKNVFPGAQLEEMFFFGLSVFSWNLIFSITLLFFMFYTYTQFYSELTDNLNTKQAFLLTEITRRSESELRTQQLFKDLTVSYKSLEQFSFIVSHNIRSPLANIKGLCLLFEKDSSPNEVIIENILKSVNRLDTVLYDLNDLLKIKQEILVNKEPIKVTEAVDYCKKSLFVEIEKTGANIVEEYDNNLEISTIKSIFHSILINIIQNSIKYKKENRIPEIKISAHSTQNQLVVTVTDNGLGIDSELYGEKMFRLYSRFHLDIEGKGIGLYLVKTQLDLIGGSIEIHSKPNEGCKITLYFNL